MLTTETLHFNRCYASRRRQRNVLACLIETSQQRTVNVDPILQRGEKLSLAPPTMTLRLKHMVNFAPRVNPCRPSFSPGARKEASEAKEIKDSGQEECHCKFVIHLVHDESEGLSKT